MLPTQDTVPGSRFWLPGAEKRAPRTPLISRLSTSSILAFAIKTFALISFRT